MIDEYGEGDLSVIELKLQIDPIWLIPNITCIDFKPPKKSENNSLLMKQLFYQHIYEKHRNTNHVYTDGSKIDDRVGCAVVYRDSVYTKKLAKHTGIYNAELAAVLKAVKLAEEDVQSAETVIFTDSQSVKQSIEDRNSLHPLIAKILRLVLKMQSKGKTITVCWVPAHLGISQNESADEGAKAAAESASLVNNLKVYYRDYYPVFRMKVIEEWGENWRGVIGNKLRDIKEGVTHWDTSRQKNRRQEVLLCRLRIGHTKMTHGWLMEGSQPPKCHNCNELLTVKHMLVDCIHYARIRARIYPQTTSMNGRDALQYMLGDRGGRFDIDALMTFVMEMGLENFL